MNRLKRAWQLLFDDSQAEIDALEITIKELEKQKTIILTQISICRWKLAEKNREKMLSNHN